MSKWDKDFSNTPLDTLIEYENELLCDIELDQEKILDFQLQFQKGKLGYDEYMDSYQKTTASINKLKENRTTITKTINHRMSNIENDLEDVEIDDMSADELVSKYLKDISFGGYIND